MKTTKLVALVSLALLAPITLPQAATIQGVSFPDRVEVAGKPLVLNGVGVRLATLVKVKVYLGALYVEKKESDADSILRSSSPKRVRMHFLRDVGAKKIREAWQESFGHNCSPNCDALRPELTKLLGLVTDAKKGDDILVDFVADQTTLTIRGQTAGQVAGGEFGRVLLMSWLGPKPPNSELKAGMLGR